jgi:hypothetical protein
MDAEPPAKRPKVDASNGELLLPPPLCSMTDVAANFYAWSLGTGRTISSVCFLSDHTFPKLSQKAFVDCSWKIVLEDCAAARGVPLMIFEKQGLFEGSERASAGDCILISGAFVQAHNGAPQLAIKRSGGSYLVLSQEMLASGGDENDTPLHSKIKSWLANKPTAHASLMKGLLSSASSASGRGTTSATAAQSLDPEEAASILLDIARRNYHAWTSTMRLRGGIDRRHIFSSIPSSTLGHASAPTLHQLIDAQRKGRWASSGAASGAGAQGGGGARTCSFEDLTVAIVGVARTADKQPFLLVTDPSLNMLHVSASSKEVSGSALNDLLPSYPRGDEDNPATSAAASAVTPISYYSSFPPAVPLLVDSSDSMHPRAMEMFELARKKTEERQAAPGAAISTQEDWWWRKVSISTPSASFGPIEGLWVRLRNVAVRGSVSPPLPPPFDKAGHAGLPSVALWLHPDAGMLRLLKMPASLEKEQKESFAIGGCGVSPDAVLSSSSSSAEIDGAAIPPIRGSSLQSLPALPSNALLFSSPSEGCLSSLTAAIKGNVSVMTIEELYKQQQDAPSSVTSLPDSAPGCIKRIHVAIRDVVARSPQHGRICVSLGCTDLPGIGEAGTSSSSSSSSSSSRAVAKEEGKRLFATLFLDSEDVEGRRFFGTEEENGASLTAAADAFLAALSKAVNAAFGLITALAPDGSRIPPSFPIFDCLVLPLGLLPADDCITPVSGPTKPDRGVAPEKRLALKIMGTCAVLPSVGHQTRDGSGFAARQ